MRAGCPACSSAECDDLTSTDLCADAHLDLREVHIDAHQAESVVDDYAAPLVVERLREDDTAGVDGSNGSTWLGPVVETTMNAGKFSVEDSLIAEGVRLWGKMQRRPEVSGPLWLRGCVGEGFVLHNFVGGDFLEGCRVGFDKFVWNAQ